MTTAKHTPGPWELEAGSDYIRICTKSGERYIIDDLLWATYDEEEMANARLIAAAPELLEANYIAQQRIIGVLENHRNGESLNPAILQGALDALCAAIAKAEDK